MADPPRPATPRDEANSSASLGALLARLADSPPSALLTLIRADQRQRWRQGERLPAEIYFAHLPDLSQQTDIFLDIIFSEVAIRQELGETPTPDEYASRFPPHEATIRRQFLLNAALDDGSLLDDDSAVSSTLGPSMSSVLTTGDPPSTVTLPPSPGQTERDSISPTIVPPRRHKAMPHVPGYEILGELGRGGMGVVYKAKQLTLKRLVALKMILAGSHASANDLARLRSEAEAVARLRHPNIVQIYEVGEQNGLPYLALEFVEGGSLAHRLDAGPFPASQAAALIESLAGAIHHAHQQGIVHRDLKPANVLLAGGGRQTQMAPSPLGGEGKGEGEGLATAAPSPLTPLPPGERGTTRPPLADDVPKITDFGLAKCMEAGSGLTGTGAIVGTPSYMSPEQAAGQTHAIGPASDVYALGAILYEMLTGRPPFRAANPVDTILQVISVDAVPPTQLQPNVPDDLENICLKSLQKEPARRYPTAQGLADDLAAFREGRPVAARPISRWERVVKWARRRPAVAALTAVSLLVSVVAFVIVTWEWQVACRALGTAEAALFETELARQDEHQQRLAKEEALRQAKVSLYFNRIALAEREWAASHVGGVLALLQGAPPELRDWEWYYLQRLCHGGLLTVPGRDCVALSPDGQFIAAGSGKLVKLWEKATGKELFTLGPPQGHTSRVNHIVFGPDGTRLASAGDDGTIRLWNPKTGELILTVQRPNTESDTRPALRAVAFAPSDDRLAAGGDDETVTVWDLAKQKIVCEMSGHSGNISSVAYSPDGKRIASASKDRTIRLWDAATGRLTQTLHGHTAPVTAVAFRADSKVVASAGEDHTIRLWDSGSGQELRRLAHPSPVNDLSFAGDGRLASVTGDYLQPGELRVWNSATGQLVRTFRWPTQEVTGVAFSADGKRLATADARSVVLWDASNDLESRALWDHKEGVMATAFSPTGPYLASAGEDWMLKIWDLQKEETIHDCAGHTATINALAYAPDGKRLVTASDDRTVKVWDPATGLAIHTLAGHSAAVLSVAISPDGRTLASAASTPDLPGEVKLWDLQTGKEIKTLSARWIRTLAYSSDGKRLAGALERPFEVVVWDVASGAEVRSLSGFLQPVSAIAFSRDGRWLAASGGSKREGIIKLWDAATGEEHEPIRTRTGRIGSIAFSPDSKRLIAASWDYTLMLFDPLSRQDVLTLRGHTDGVTAVAFSADGWRIASASRDKTVRLWNATPLPSK